MSKFLTLGIVVLCIIGAIFLLQSEKVTPGGVAEKSPLASSPSKNGFKSAQEISTPDAFINTASTTISEQLIAGNIVLVDFWTYSCINCQRTTPYLNAWHEAYGSKGLTIIGIHTPEFQFEKELANVEQAVTQFGIKYPVVLDNDYSTWRAYGNRYWPRKYLVNMDGYIVYDHIGEGGYEETEEQIRTLLRERAERLGVVVPLPETLVSTTITAGESAIKDRTPEIYFGSARNAYLANITRGIDGPQDTTLPDTYATHRVYLDGSWIFAEEHTETAEADTTIVLRFIGNNVNIVAESPQETVLSLSLDGEELDSVTVKEPGLYTLVEGLTDADPHTLEISIPDAGLKVFTFTFG